MGFFLVRSRTLIVSVAVAALAGSLSATPASAATTADAALLPVMAPDLLEPQKRAIDERIRAVAAESGVRLQPSAETTSGLDDAKKAGAACNIESAACQAQLGVLLGTKQVIVARVASDWAGDHLEVRLLDALRGSTLREAAQLLPKADGEQRRRVIDGVILSVLAPKRTGAVTLTASEGTLFLDGVEQKKDTKRFEGLAPGPHDVELRDADKKVIEAKKVNVTSDSTVDISIGKVVDSGAPTVEKSPLPLYLVGGGGALAALGVVGAGGLEAALEFNAMERGTRNVVQATGIALLGATAVGALVAGAGGVLMATDGAPAAASTAPSGVGGAP
jgi:hypothetical protein